MHERRISVVGLGGGGCKVVDCLAGGQPSLPAIVAINTDSKALTDSCATTKLQIGSTYTNGLGTGGDANLGRLAAEDDIEMIRALFVDIDLVFLIVGLGGGTGTGAAPVVLNAAHDAGATTLCFVTLPFKFEGQQRRDQAEHAVSNLRDLSDALVVVPNERLFEFVGESNMAESFRKADEVLSEGISSIWKLVTQPGFINLDFADLQKVIRNSGGICTFGCGNGRGKNKGQRAVNSLLKSPLLGRGRAIADAHSLLVSITGGADLTLKEVGDIMDAISSKAPNGAQISMGTVIEKEWQSKVSVTIVTSAVALQAIADKDKAADVAAPETKSKPTKEVGKHKVTQTKLKLESSGRGRFRDVEPTVLDGEDIDIPTFIRRGIAVEK